MTVHRGRNRRWTDTSAHRRATSAWRRCTCTKGLTPIRPGP